GGGARAARSSYANFLDAVVLERVSAHDRIDHIAQELGALLGRSSAITARLENVREIVCSHAEFRVARQSVEHVVAIGAVLEGARGVDARDANSVRAHLAVTGDR